MAKISIPTITTTDGRRYLDIPELRELSKSTGAYFKDASSKDDVSLRNDLYAKLTAFMDFVIQYADNIFSGKTYDFDHVVPHLFIWHTDIKTKGQCKEYLRYMLYAAMLYMKKLRGEIKPEDMPNCRDLIWTLMADYEGLLANYEVAHNTSSVNMVCHGSRGTSTPMDIKFAANQLMFLEFTGSLDQVDFRNVKPITLFVVRQCLEVYGKRMIGFEDIVDYGGHSIHQFTQVAWTFLQEMERQGKNVVKLPFKASTVQKLNSWTNHFVHHPYVENCFVQSYALEFLFAFGKPITFKSSSSGRTVWNVNHGDFVIPDYGYLKQEFTDYIRKTRPNLKFKIKWMPANEVGAYIEKRMNLLLHCNIASHYRSEIYRLIDKEYKGDFCFGDELHGIKKMDYTLLNGKVTELHNTILPRDFTYQKGMLGLLRKDYDTYIICTETRLISSWLFLIIRKLFYPKKRVFAWTHGMLGKEGRLKRWMYKFQMKLLTGAFIYNERSTKLMVERGVPAYKLRTIYNSLDYDAQLPIRKSLIPSHLYRSHFGNTNKNIVFIGRLTKVKRFDLLIDAIFDLKTRGEVINVTFIGDGVERNNMESRVRELGIQNQVWFYGACYDEKTNAELIFNADLCVSPGNIGLTAMHVLMFGCPAITNDDFNHQMPEFEAIQEGKTGAFFKAGDSKSLADTISQWFALHRTDRDDVREACYFEIDSKWNPHVQMQIFNQML